GHDVEDRWHRVNRREESRDPDHGIQNRGADRLRESGRWNDAGDEKSDRQDAQGADQQRKRETEPWNMNADRVVPLACKHHQGQDGRGERQLDDHVRSQDCLWTQRSGAEPFENSPFAVDGDDGYQRYHRADRDQERRENWQAQAEKTIGRERRRREVAASYSPDHEEHDNRETDGPKCAERLTHEDLNLDPG